MKTSNKILLGLLIVIFALPFLLAYSLKGKIEKGEYTVEKWDNERNRGTLHTGSFTSFKVVHVYAPSPNLLRVHLTQSDKMTYNYYTGDRKDSVDIFTSSDTLHVRFVSQTKIGPENRIEYGENITVQLGLPAFSALVVDGAMVVIDSLPAAQNNMSVTIKNRGVIEDGGKNGAKTTNVPAASLNAGRDLPAAEQPTTSISNYANKLKSQAIKSMQIELPDIDIKDFVMFRLL